MHDREILHALPNHKRLRSCGLFPSSLERSEISDMRSHAAPDVLAISMQPPSTSSIVEHVSSDRFASPHAISRLNGPCDMVFSIVGLSGWILRNGLLHQGTPCVRSLRYYYLNCLLHCGTLRDDLMQRATLQKWSSPSRNSPAGFSES